MNRSWSNCVWHICIIYLRRFSITLKDLNGSMILHCRRSNLEENLTIINELQISQWHQPYYCSNTVFFSCLYRYSLHKWENTKVKAQRNSRTRLIFSCMNIITYQDTKSSYNVCFSYIIHVYFDDVNTRSIKKMLLNSLLSQPATKKGCL